MTKKRDIHVVPHRDGCATRAEGSHRVSSTHRTQSDASAAARDRAVKDKVEAVTHRPNGRIRDSDSHGRDLDPPMDKKH